MYICTFIYVCIYTHIYACVFYTYMHICVCIYIYRQLTYTCIWKLTTVRKFEHSPRWQWPIHSLISCLFLLESRIISNKWLWVSQQKYSFFHPTDWIMLEDMVEACSQSSTINTKSLVLDRLPHAVPAASHLSRRTVFEEVEETKPQQLFNPR